MAKILDKDPFTYQKERDSFLRDLSRFHAGRGTSYSGFPCLGGKEVDLYLLYSKVTQLGGWVKVTNEQKWEEIEELFHIPPACVNAAQALKIIYVRYLSHYEKVHHFGEDPDRIRDDQLDDNSVQSRKKTTGPVGGVPMYYNYGQHNIPDHVRESMGLKVPKHLVASGEYKNLVHSLMSGLPNEVDFALNICTLLSNEGQHTIELQKCPHLLKLLLAHMGIYGHDHESLYMLHEQGWKNYTKRNFPRFWYDSVQDEKIRKFLAPDSLQVSKFTTSFSPPPLPSPESVGDEAMDCVTDMTEEQSSEDNEPDLANVFALDRDMGMYDIEGQRVLQLAMIIRNLSFEKGNMKVLSKDVATFRFLMLCIHSKYNALRQLALDTLSNIALEMVLSPVSLPMTKLVFQLIAHCIASPDKFDVISGLDMLARLCQVEANEEVICDNLEDATYEKIVHLLTIHDIQLIVYSLETLYQLSELGEVTTTHIAAIRMAVETLVNLVTVEAQAYGPESLVGIKVVEHVTTIPLTGEKVVPTTSQASIQQQMAVQQPATLVQPEQKLAQTAHAGVGLTNSNLNKGKKPMSVPLKRPPCHVTPARPGPVITPPPVTPSPAALTKAAVQPLKAQPGLDSDTLACNWLQAHYEFVGTDGKAVEEIPKMELYGEFLTTCGRLFIKNIANASCFANCVRMTFSKVESVKVKRSDGTTEQIYRGLKKRDLPLPFPPNTEFGSIMPPVHGLQRAPTPNAALPSSPQVQLQHSSIGQPRHHLMSAHGNQLNSPPLSPVRYPQAVASTGSPISPTHYPTIQQALLGGRGQDGALKSPLSQSAQQTVAQGTNSTLIKSLLANKVSQNICRQQGEQIVSQNSSLEGQRTLQQAHQVLQQQSQESGSHGTGSGAHQVAATASNPAKNKTGTSSPPGTLSLKSKLQTRFRSSKSRNNGNDVVITDSKTIENLIESVARHGSVEGDEHKLVQKGAAGLGVSSNDVCIMQVQGGLEKEGRDKLTEKAPEADSDNGRNAKVGPSGDACIPSVNGTSTQSSSELNGDRASVRLNLAEVTSCRVVIDKAKPQHILNGAVHHFGNGNCNKLAKSKDLEKVNSKICETQVVMNSQSEASCKKRDSSYQDDCSVRSVVGCDDEDEKTGSKEVSKEVLENGYALPVAEKSCEVPQLDGTVDEDEAPKTGASTVATQQNSSMPQTVSSGAQLSALTGGTSVTATGSQGLPVKVVYTQGLVTQGQLAQSLMDSSTTVKIQPSSVQSQIQRLTSAGRTVTYVPQAAQPQLQGQPQVVHGQPQIIQGQAQVVPGQTQVIHGQPQVVQGQPQVVQAQPQVVQSQLQVVQGQPQVVQGQRQVVQGQPQAVQGQPQVVQGQPQIVQGQPQVVQGQTQVVQGQVQVVQSGSSHAQPQLAAGQPGQQQIVHNPLQLQQQQLQLQQQQLQMQLQQLQQMQQQIQQQWIQTQQQLSQTVGQQGTVTTSQPQPSTTQSNQSYIIPKGPSPATTSTEQSTATSQPAQLSPNQQQTYILPKPQSQQQQQQQQVQMVLRPQQLTQQIQAVNQQASLAISAAKSGQAQSSIVGLPVSVQAVSTQQPHSSQSSAVQAPSQISVQATRFVLPQGQMAVRPQMSVRPITSQYTQVQQQATTTVQSQQQLAQSQATAQQPTATSQTQVLQSQVRPQLVQGQAVTQTGQAQVIQQAVRTHLVQQPHMIPTHGQPQVLAPTQVMQQHFLQQRQLMQQVSQQGQVIQPIQGQNVVVSGQSQAQLASQAVLQRPQYIQSQVVSGHLPTATTQSQQLLQGQPQVIQTQAQFLQKGQLVQPGSTPQLIQQTTATGAKVTVVVPSQQQLLQYQQSINSQQQLIQKQLATSIAQQQQQQQQQQKQQQPATSVSQPAVTAPTIQIPVSQLTLPLSQTSTPQSASVTSSPVSTPPPPSPQSSKASLPSPNTLALNKKKRPAPIPPQMEKCFKKKKPMMNIIESRPPTRNQTAVSQPSPVVSNKYHCEWAGCKQWFDTIKLFNRHVIKEHFEKQHQQAVCKWDGCDGLRRPKWSLMTHLQDRHLNDTSLKNPAKKPEPSPPTTNIPKPPPPAAPSGGVPGGPVPVYPDNAAIQAIRRFAAKPPFPEFVEMKEGPVTKHIRFTSALVLRNLARYSALGRSMLKKHEEQLSFVALSAVEASSPIANCLWELHQTDPH